MSSIVLTADTSLAEQQVQRFEMNTRQVAAAQVMALRRAVEVGILTVQAFGVVIDQTMRAYIDIATVGIETIIQTRAALVAADPLAAVTQAAFGAMQVFFLVQLINSIKQGRTRQAAQMQASVTLLRQTGAFLR